MDTALAERYFEEASNEAKKSLCLRDKCGAIIVSDGKVVGRGYNAPPNDDLALRRCDLNIIQSPKPKSDRTCCVHAEWRAIIDAIRHEKKLDGSTLFFTRVDRDGNILKSGQPYCTVCSRLALDNGVGFFALWHENGIGIYDTKEYDELSYRFHRQ